MRDKGTMKFDSCDRFYSLSEFIDTSINTPRTNESKGNSSEKERSGWAGSKDMAETLEIAENGYELDKISAELEGIKSAERYELNQSFQVSGSEVDLGMYMEDIPECMVEFDMIESKKFVNLIIGVVESAGISSEQIMHRAVAVCSIIDRLESNNYRVKLSLSIANIQFSTNGHKNWTYVDVKGYKEPMSIAHMAGILHTGFYRRLIFRYWEGHKNFNSYSGYGRVGSDKNSIDAVKQSGFVDEEFVYLPSITEKEGGSYSKTLESRFSNVQDAEEYAKDVQDRIEELTETGSSN